MSKGLGKTQKYIMDFLAKEGTYKTAFELAAWKGVPEGEMPVQPSPSAVVSMRRAIRALAERRLLNCGIAPYRRDLGGPQLVCWLPDQPPPSALQKHKIRGAVAEAMVLKALEDVAKSEYAHRWLIDREAQQMHRTQDKTVPDVFYEYESVSNVALRTLERIAYENAARTAIRRAVDRLNERGEIEAYKNDKNQYGWLRLSVARS